MLFFSLFLSEFLQFDAKLLKKNEINEGFLRNISYFCIVKRKIALFKTFLACVTLLLGCFTQVLASEAPTSGATPSDTLRKADPMDSVEVSLLTCQPHDEVYSLYGHTAIRVQDHRNGQDFAVNYGCFDSTADYFVLRFIFGLTDYMMGIFSFDDFRAEYRFYGSEVRQQRINLTPAEKRAFLAELAKNAQPENVVYRYNYYYNNCTTRARDIIFSSINGKIDNNATAAELNRRGKITFRDLIHEKTPDHLWARFGNDILLGVGSDRKATFEQQQYIPDVLMGDFDNYTITNADGTIRPLVDSAYVVVEAGTPYHPDGADFPLSPSTCALIVLCVILAYVALTKWLQRNGNEKTVKIISWIDYAWCVLYALPGIVLTAMIFSQHPTVSLNLQILMFCPLWFVLACPRCRWKYRWHLMMACLVLFFLGNIMQQYAEGMNIMALGLFAIVCKNMLNMFAQLKKNQ